MKLKQLVLLLFLGKVCFGQVTYIKFSEYSFSNITTVMDPIGTTGPSGSPDWIEVRNVKTAKPGTALEQLSGWYLSDDRSNLHKWQFPYYNNLPIKLDSGQVQVVFLCGHDKAQSSTVDTTGIALHANFEVNQTKRGGAVLYLTRSVNATTPSDSIHIKLTQPNHSWGRCWEKGVPNAVWRLYAKPTPYRYNPKWPFYYKDYLPKPQFDRNPGYYSTLPTVNITDTSTLSSTTQGYINYPGISIFATTDCTKPDTQAVGSTVAIAASGALGTPLTGAIQATNTVVPNATGCVIRAIMHDGTTPTSSVTPKYYDSFETYGAYYDSSYQLTTTCVCIDTTALFVGLTQDTVITTIFDYFSTNGIEIMRNQGQSMISKLDFYNPFGGASLKQQWQFTFRAEDEYGYNYTNPYQFFQDPVVGVSKRADFPELMFRAGGEEGFIASNTVGVNGFPPTHVRDYYNHTMTMRHKLNFEQAHYTPTYLLINGVNRGIYYIKEPFDSTYTDYYFGRPKAAILRNGIVSGGTIPVYGTVLNNTPAGVVSGFGNTNSALTHWSNFYNWAMLPGTKVHIPGIFQELSDSIDFQSLNDYTIYNMLSVNADYLKRSAMWWKGLPTDTSDHRPSKWRMALANTDITWGFNENNYNNILDNTPTSSPCDFMGAFSLNWPPTTAIPANAASYPIMTLWNKLMDNDTFESAFISRYSDLLNSALSCDSLEDHLKYIRTTLPKQAMNSHVFWNLYDGTNFPAQDSVHYWNQGLDSMYAFIAQRCSLVTDGMKNCFNKEGPYNLCVDVFPTGTGYVTLNSLTLKNFIWNGKYLDSVTMIAKGIPYQNYVFDHWETSPTSYTLNPNNKSDSINFFVSRDVCLKAVFKLKPAEQTYGEPMIPTGFSPNGDGNNDVFNIYGIAESSSYELEIYNRWGEMIFRSVDKAHGWDGSFNGAPAPLGIYAYRYNIIMNGKTYKSKGSVTLLR